MKISVNVKSGTGGWYDYEGCDKNIIDLNTEFIPRVGDILDIAKEGEKMMSYLVREVNIHYNIPKENGKWIYGEFITVYVIPC